MCACCVCVLCVCVHDHIHADFMDGEILTLKKVTKHCEVSTASCHIYTLGSRCIEANAYGSDVHVMKYILPQNTEVVYRGSA